MNHRTLFSTGSDFERQAGYSRALVQRDAAGGAWCLLAGTTGYDYDSMTLPADLETQTRNALGTIEKTLVDAGFALSDVVRMTYYVTDRAFVATVFPILGERLGDIRPAATMVLAELIEPAMKIEIEATAYRPIFS